MGRREIALVGLIVNGWGGRNAVTKAGSTARTIMIMLRNEKVMEQEVIMVSGRSQSKLISSMFNFAG
jgi:hypothetical protein